ncbi:class I SAM-dependent methyltransferase [Desulfosediminicola sp.]|uniref:class I SAM-dependent methyltransferase n=1 Tax=Desulfosediminicola sp. TaxID=2886825 RepID=UPI003AF25F61
MIIEKEELAQLIIGMHAAFSRGENAMAWARANSKSGDKNSTVSTLIAYDLQSGSYVDAARKNPEYTNAWCEQLSELVKPYVDTGGRILEVGVGEGTTFAGVLRRLKGLNISAYGFDLSWSRVSIARSWIESQEVLANLFVGDLFRIPLRDNSIDVVYTSHSLEPNGGKEEIAIKELLRVARNAVVLVEPCYELASEEARKRMLDHGYVRSLKAVAESLGAHVEDYRLLDVYSNSLNRSGVIALTKPRSSEICVTQGEEWACPLTGALLSIRDGCHFAADVGIAYPTLQGIPLLRAEHAVVASKFGTD